MAYESIFKKYDIRGIYDEELDENFAYKLGRALVRFLGVKEVAIARDGRESSPSLFAEFSKGVLDESAKVIDLGIISTPAAYYSFWKGEYKAGVVVTASHNPGEYNGFKIVRENVSPVHLENGFEELMKLVNQEFDEGSSKGIVESRSYMEEYKNYLSTLLSDTKRDAVFVFDQSNGSGWVESEFLKELYNNVTILNGDVDGSFPGHKPDPLPEVSREALVKNVLEKKARFGVIVDGDADRAIFVDEKGCFVRPESLLSVILEDNAEKILYDVRVSHALKDTAESKGLETKMIPCGRTVFLDHMVSENATYGVEGSGHYFFKEFNGLDSAIIAVIKLLNKLSETDIPLSELVKNNSKGVHSGEINFRVDDREKALDKIKNSFNPNNTSELDGLSMFFDNAWFNIRKSNTEPLIRLNAEAKDKNDLDELVGKIKQLVT